MIVKRKISTWFLSALLLVACGRGGDCADSREQPWLLSLVILTLIIAFLMTYMLIRRREAHRLNVAYGLLKERNDELEIANQKAEESSRMKTKFIQQN